MTKHIKSIVAGLVFGLGIGGLGLAAFSPSAESAPQSSEVARISPQNLCEIVNANKPGRHWCDRKGHLHYR